MIRSTTVSALLLSLVAVTAHAAGPDAGLAKIDVSSLAVSKALSETLARDGVARIEVTLDLTKKRTAAELEHPVADTDVHPAVFDIAMMAARGPMQLDPAGDFHLLRIAATTPAVNKILGMKEVVAVRLDDAPVAETKSAKASSCSGSTSTSVCLGHETSEVTAKYGGVTGKVASEGWDAAVFWAYSPDNWEILVKNLDGCSINGHGWLFAAAAGTQTYSVKLRRFGFIDLGWHTATNAPIVNTSLYECQ